MGRGRWAKRLALLVACSMMMSILGVLPAVALTGDTTPPTISHTPGGTYNTDSLTVDVSAVDPAGCDWVGYYVMGQGTGYTWTSGGSRQFTLSGYGAYQVQFTATDALGNQGSTEWVTYILEPAATAPVAQTIDNGALKLTVSPEAGPAAFVWGQNPGDAPGTLSWVNQYFGGTGWGSVVWLNGTSYSSGYVVPAESFVPVSNMTETLVGGKRIVTVVDLGTSGVRMTQTFTLMDGERFFTKDWTFENLGETAIDSLKFYHGGDTYFGGEDAASGYYDAGKSMVYISNARFENWGIMGFYSNPGTPADHYFEGNYFTGYTYAMEGQQLPDSVDSSYGDAGYCLEWTKSSLAAGASWSVQAYEVWTPGGPVQVLAPGPQSTLNGGTVVLPFTLQNLSQVPQDLTLSAESDKGWTVTVLGDTTPAVGATERLTVLVQVEVPSGPAATVGSSKISLSAKDSATDVTVSTASTTLDALDSIGLSVEPGEFTYNTAPGEKANQPIVVTNNGRDPFTFGTVTVSDPDHFSLGDGAALSGATLNPGESMTIDPCGFMSEEPGTFRATLNLPIVSPVLVTRTVQLTGICTAPPAEVVQKETAGADRYATALASSAESFPNGAGAVVIATGEKFPDALGGSALAGVLDAPILLSRSSALSAGVVAEVQRLGATEVYVLGSSAALSPAVQTALADVVGAENVHRIGGANRYITANAIAAKVIELRGESYDGKAFVATGEGFTDALAASPIAAANGRPVYLAPREGITAGTLAAMQVAGVTDCVILGGETAIPAGTSAAISGAGMTVMRINGADRYETAAKIAEYGVTDCGMHWDGVALAAGDRFADALCGGAAQGEKGSVMLLTATNALPSATRAALMSHGGSITEVRFFGGLSAISQSVRDVVAMLF